MGAEGTDEGPRVTHVEQVAAIPAALDGTGMARAMPVLVLVGGAKGMDEQALETLAAVLRDVVVPCLERHGAAAVDGGTDSGVMRMLGRARAGHEFPLVGVAAEKTVRVPGGGPVIDDAADLEPHHTHLLLVPGDTWGDESPWLADVADAIAAGQPSLTVVVNGGEITYKDALASLERGRRVVALAGTGRAADAIADARAGSAVDPRAAEVAASPLTQVVAVDDGGALNTAIDTVLGGSR